MLGHRLAAERAPDSALGAVTDVDRAILQEMLAGVGAIVMGRKSFDKNEGDGGWGDGGPVGDTPCFVVTPQQADRVLPSPVHVRHRRRG